jgi:hypothetical protein
MTERAGERFTAYYCEKHKRFQPVKRTFHEFDLKFDLEKLMAELNCGCKLWIATVERDPAVLAYLSNVE